MYAMNVRGNMKGIEEMNLVNKYLDTLSIDVWDIVWEYLGGDYNVSIPRIFWTKAMFQSYYRGCCRKLNQIYKHRRGSFHK